MKSNDIIHQLRTSTAGVTAIEAARLLSEARDRYAALPPDEQTEAVGQTLEFIDVGKPSPTTIHNRLDHLVPLLDRLDAGDLVVQFKKASPQVFEHLPGSGKSAPLYKTLRTFWRFLSPGVPVPKSLQYYRKSQTISHYLLSRDEFGDLLRCFHQKAKFEDQIIWFYLASVLRLRKIELKNLCLNDIWLEQDRLTAFVLGKGEKRRQMSAQIPDWMRARIQDFILGRKETSAKDTHAPFFNLEHISDGKIQIILEQASLPISPHDLRRYQANLARANDEPILEGIGKLGHSTSQTAMTSYVTVLPLLQAEALHVEYHEHWASSFAAGISANSLARSMGVSREAVRQYKSKMGYEAGRLSLAEATQVVAFRIRNAIGRLEDQSTSMTRIKSS